MSAPSSHRWPATAIVAAVRTGTITCEAVARDCLDHISLRDPQIGAWQTIHPDDVIAQARKLDTGDKRGPLIGVPIGVKDVIDTFDLPTAYGSPIYRAHQPASDAACVAQMRAAGAIIMGKTVTTEFATLHPGKTRNPHRLEHTPGGSSSGSAAAVADFMVPAAFGTQTSSSILRPAAYCGVVGYKPTYNRINRAGLKPLAESLDTIGVLTRTVPDAALIVGRLCGAAAIDFSQAAHLTPRIGFCRTPQWNSADQATQHGLESLAVRLAACGATVATLDLPQEYDRLADAQRTIFAFETFRSLSHERLCHPEMISANLTARLNVGSTTSHEDYIAAQALAIRCQQRLDDVFKKIDVLLVPSATGEAPRDLAQTGNPVFGLIWTLLHTPTVTLPLLRGPTDLPLGAQFIGNRGTDERLLLVAEWVSQKLLR